jgi:ribonuclease HII
MQPSFLTENLYEKMLVCGIDEAGRGPLAGPVVAGCVILNKNSLIEGINDSKKLSKTKRRKIFTNLTKTAFFGVGIVDEKIIDKINILNATKLAMHRAFVDLQNKYKIFPEIILVDGNFIPFDLQDQIKEIIPIVKGDSKSLSIAAASIVAKETRDQIMEDLHQKYPQFQFNKHAGYPTKAHVENIKKFGISPIHRQSFEPIKSMLNENN